MYSNYTISVIIPCHNEGKRLDPVLKAIPGYIDEIIVVDNASTDDTSDVAHANKAKVIFEKRKGYGRAYKTGLHHVSKDIIFAIDGDGAFSPDQISNLLDIIIEENLDFIWGNRFCSENTSKMRLLNYLGNRILTIIMSWLYGQKISDSQSGLWIFKRTLLNDLHLLSDGMAFSEEIKIEVISNKNIKFKEVPVVCRTNANKRNIIALFYEGMKNLIFLFQKKVELFFKRKVF